MRDAELTLRLATPEDAAVIASHRVRMFLEAKGWPEERGAELLATADGTVVAGAGVQVRDLIPRLEVLAGPEALVVNVFVEPTFRRGGLARQLMVAILDWCRAEGIGRIVLHPTDAARSLYESLGFSTSGELNLYS